MAAVAPVSLIAGLTTRFAGQNVAIGLNFHH
jgi:hypothetical protein